MPVQLSTNLCTFAFTFVMFWCYICGDGKASLTGFRIHINKHATDYELVRPIKCCQGACKATFVKPYNFFRHLTECHAADQVNENRGTRIFSVTSGVGQDNGNDNLLDTGNDGDSYGSNDYETTDCSIKAIQHEGTLLVASLRANSSIPYSVIPSIVESVNAISNSIIAACQAEAEHHFSESVTDLDNNHLVTNFKSKLSNSLNDLRSPLDFLLTKCRQDSYFESNENFVKPESVNFGLRFETRCGQTKIVYDTFEYISIEKNLRCLLQKEDYVRALLEGQTQSDVISHYSNGELAQVRVPYVGRDKISLVIQLFYDGMGTTNPLRGSSVMCNVGVFYYVVKNLPDWWNSCFANVHLLALCYEQDLKVHGFGSILDKFCDEMHTLNSSGFNGVFPIVGDTNVCVTLGQVSCDNLALNSILGFIESFSGDFFCTLCYATRESMQCFFTEDCFCMRTREEYDRDVSKLTSLSGTVNHVRGVKRSCELNKLNGFHVTENYSNDVMHSVLEGLVPIELGCILFALISEKRLFSLDQLNRMVIEFWGTINVDVHKRPPQLNRILAPGEGLNPSMKATQSWALLKYLPLIIGDQVPGNDVHYKFLLHLSDLVDHIFAPRFTHGTVVVLKELITEHLALFVKLFGSQVTLKPKHHFMVHLPTIIIKSGPLVGMSCLRYEMKNSFFKRSAHIVCNFINISKTLAYRHQHYAMYSIMSNAYKRGCFVVGQSQCLSVASVLQGAIECALCETLDVESTDDVVVTYKLKRDSYEYKTGHFFLCGYNNDEHVFGEAVCFVCRTDEEQWHIVMRMFDTTGYVPHFHSYAVRETIPQSYCVLTFSALLDHHAICRQRRQHQNRSMTFVRLPYWIF